ncbi:MAG: hypothetical protein JEZ04_21250 [Spirochaetales bacterium]|nr:hypothetical protein [Spirochaetales bacterium]
MKKRIYSILITAGIAAVLLFSGCVMNKLDNTPQAIVLRAVSGGTGLEIDVSAGEQWASRMQAGPFIFNVLPQMAIWLEDGNGEYVETLYVTGADFKKLRHAAKNGDGAGFFSECLPYWASRVESAGEALPSKENPYPDTITSATPMGDFTLDTMTASEAPIVIFAELNKSGDENAFFTKEANGWAGQPSLIYRADIRKLQAGDTVKLKLEGQGGMLGVKAGIFSDLNGFDTALKQVREITVSFE